MPLIIICALANKAIAVLSNSTCPLSVGRFGPHTKVQRSCSCTSSIAFYSTILMKGTKVLTLGAGREVLPHNVAVTKDAYIHAL